VKENVPAGNADLWAISGQASTCSGGLYRLLVTSPSGTVPTLAQDDVTP
jgi:hypothetical protein